MPDTRLILHVKGTESQTQELPKEEVKTALAEGKLSYSQLIWSAPDHAWKQIRDLPELLPAAEESLILHVKGTDQTREMPKKALKEAIARGEITHSQLIWSANDSSWKQVREIPELLPGETLILHVKGTQSETRELPKPAIRAAIQKGEITQSQLIWSPLDSAWKPVSEMPDLQPGESLILHVKGTTADTKEMPKKAIRTAIKEGKITHSQLIWSSAEHSWKQVRELPELLPSQKLAPAPVRRPMAPMLDSITPDSPQGPVARAVAATPAATPQPRPAVAGPPRVSIASASAQPKVAVAQPAAAQPGVAVPAGPRVAAAQPTVAAGQAPAVRVAAAAPKVMAAPSTVEPAPAVIPHASAQPHEGHVVEEHEDGFHPVKWICIGLTVLIAVIVAANYVLVNRPYKTAFAQTNYGAVFTYAHYGAFVQPNVIVIHIPPSDKITPDNITEFMVAVAQSTPRNPMTNDDFDRVALTSGWTAQYSFSGSAWKHLGDMKGQSADDIRTQLLSNGFDAGGQPLLGESTLNEAAQEARRNRAWDQFVAHFAKGSAQ